MVALCDLFNEAINIYHRNLPQANIGDTHSLPRTTTAPSNLTSYADVLRSGTCDKAKNVCVGGYVRCLTIYQKIQKFRLNVKCDIKGAYCLLE